MLSFLLAIHFLLAILIIGLVLIQKHEADGVLGTGGSGGANKMFSVRGQANILTRSTAVLMTLFIINCLVMAKMLKHTPQKESIIDRVAKENAPVAPVGNVAKENPSKENDANKNAIAVDEKSENTVNTKTDTVKESQKQAQKESEKNAENKKSKE